METNVAASILRRGGLVAFPTETVYGLGADATNANAVRQIFSIKGRPPTNPLIVHVASSMIARRYTTEWPDIAHRLAERFWPGPLTLVLRKTEAIVSEVSAGGMTVGLRVPDHPLALQLLADFDGPVAAPSANRSNRISPTTAEHVRAELGQGVDLILDGGPCMVGIESTVLDLTSPTPRILRPGGVSRDGIQEVIGEVTMLVNHLDPGTSAKSPGQSERHYAPKTPAFRFFAERLPIFTARAAIIAHTVNVPGNAQHTMPLDAPAYARKFYYVLRALDAQGFDAIYIEWPVGGSQWDAIRDRIKRATIPA